MTVLVDTGVLVADQNPRDPRHDAAAVAMQAAHTGVWGRVSVTDYVVDEAVTLCRVRTRRHDLADGLAARLLGEPPHKPAFTLHRVNYADFLEARRLFSEYHDHDLSFTDCTILAVLSSRSIDHLLSFDDDFDGLAPRVEAPP